MRRTIVFVLFDFLPIRIPFVQGKHEAEMARKLKVEAEKSYVMLKDKQKATQEELAQTKVKLEKAARDVSSLDQRLGRTSEENVVLRKKAAMQV